MGPLLLHVTVCIVALTMAQPQISEAPSGGVALQDQSGLLLTNVRVITQKMYFRADPLELYRRHARNVLAVGQKLEPESQVWVEDIVSHATSDRTHILGQMLNFAITREDLTGYAVHSRTKADAMERQRAPRDKRFAFSTLFTVASALTSLFSIGMTSVNTVSVSTIRSQVEVINRDLPIIRKQLDTHGQQIQALSMTVRDTVVLVNSHTEILNKTARAMTTFKKLMGVDFSHSQIIGMLMTDFLRELSSSVDLLAMGKIPHYLTPLELVEQILRRATGGKDVSDIQVHLAYSLGGAVPLAVDPERGELVFLLTLPVIESQDIYRLKNVVNVGYWKDDAHLEVITPPVVAYHDSSPDFYLAPNLDLCTKTKDIHYLCPSKPFIQQSEHLPGICGLQAVQDHSHCRVKATPRHEVIQARAQILNDKWLVSSPSKVASVRYEVHDIATQMDLPNQTFLLSVPEKTVVQVDDFILYHLSSEAIETEIEMPDFFQKHRIEIDPATYELILTGTKTIDLTALNEVLKTTPPRDQPNSFVTAWSSSDTMLLTLQVLSYFLVIGITWYSVRRFGRVRHATERLANSYNLVRRSSKSSRSNTKPTPKDPTQSV